MKNTQKIPYHKFAPNIKIMQCSYHDTILAETMRLINELYSLGNATKYT